MLFTGGRGRVVALVRRLEGTGVLRQGSTSLRTRLHRVGKGRSDRSSHQKNNTAKRDTPRISHPWPTPPLKNRRTLGLPTLSNTPDYAGMDIHSLRQALSKMKSLTHKDSGSSTIESHPHPEEGGLYGYRSTHGGYDVHVGTRIHNHAPHATQKTDMGRVLDAVRKAEALAQLPPRGGEGGYGGEILHATSEMVQERVLALQASIRNLDSRLSHRGLSLVQVVSVGVIGGILLYGQYGSEVKEGLSREGADVVSQVVSSRELQAKLEANASALVDYLTHDEITLFQLQELAIGLLSSAPVQRSVADLVRHLIQQPWAVAEVKALVLSVMHQLKDDEVAVAQMTAFFSSVLGQESLQQSAGAAIRGSLGYALSPKAMFMALFPVSFVL